MLDEGIISPEEFTLIKKKYLEALPVSPEPEVRSSGQGQPASSTPSASNSGMSPRATAVMSYFGIIPFWLIAYFAGDRVNAKFHLNQSLVIGLAFIIAFLIPLLWICLPFVFIAWFIGLIYAIQGVDKEVPLFGRLKLLS